jgi:hypothetical protein
MQKITITLAIIMLCLSINAFLFDNTAKAQEYKTNGNDNNPVLYYFWGHCPVCSKPEDHVGLFDDYPVKVEIYEVFYDQEGRRIYDQFRNSLGIEHFGFPTLVFEDRYWLGFSDTVQGEIITAIELSLTGGSAVETQNVISLPIYGEVDLVVAPVLLTTVIIASLDGFNPCSLFVLTFLLAIIVHSASRKRILLVGITFLIVTAAVYGFFILGVLNIMLFAARLFWIRNLVAAVVIFLGMVSIKDFLFQKKGISFSIPDHYKGKFYSQVRNIFYTDAILPTILATTVMALGIALVELPCTAGFPFIWSSIVSGMDLPMIHFFFLFAVYLFFYLLIELIIFLMAVIRMRSIKMTEEKGLFLKLIAGSMMLVLGLILLIRPDYMENIVGIILAFGAAAALIALVCLSKKLVSG